MDVALAVVALEAVGFALFSLYNAFGNYGMDSESRRFDVQGMGEFDLIVVGAWHDDHFKPGSRIVQACDCLEAGRQLGPSVSGGDDDREIRRI